MPRKPIMTVNHPKWDDFADRLLGINGINVQENYTWTCFHDFKFTRRILKGMGFDIMGTITYFERNGAFCDCEVMLNIITLEDERRRLVKDAAKAVETIGEDELERGNK